MKIEFKPIAMKCTKEQFEAIKPKLKEFEIKYGIDNWPFGKREYLTNNFCREKVIALIWAQNKSDFERQVFEEWNEEIFLNACGIETKTEPQYEVTMIAEAPKEEFLEMENGNTIKLSDLESVKGFTELKLDFNPKGGNWVNKAYKETSNKLPYELDFNFITQLAERMNANKGKYKPYNWQKLDNIEGLKQALFRHVIEVMKGNYTDDSREFGHLEAIALNCMFINYQLNKNEI